MAIRVIQLPRTAFRVTAIVAALLCVFVAWLFIRWNFANIAASMIDQQRPESKLVADWLAELAPSDPQTHFMVGSIAERSFEPGELERALREYELAAELDPYHYAYWLRVARARDLNGDTDGSMAAYRRAVELAPNYAVVQWNYGNALLRNGSADEGFALIAKAVNSDPQYARPAAATALQIFGNDAAQVRRVLGDTDATNSALVSSFGLQRTFDEAAAAWSKISPEQKLDKYRSVGEALLGQLLEAKKYRLASRVAADLQRAEADAASEGKVVNGGFENAIKLANAGPFEWQISTGDEPQIGVSEAQKHSGKYGLVMQFGSGAGAFRQLSQTVPVSPGGEFEAEGFFKGDIRSSGQFKWEVSDANTGNRLAVSEPLSTSSDWVPFKMTFKVPADADGVVIRFIREGCGAAACATTGKIYLDDISIKQL